MGVCIITFAFMENDSAHFPHCRKHQCPIHHSSKGNLINDDHLKKEYNPRTHYQHTFQPVAGGGHRAMRPGLKVPPRILPDISKKGSTYPVLSVNHSDFIKVPITLRKSFKPDPKAHLSKAKLEDKTIYKLDYLQQSLAPKPLANSLMRTTIPKVFEIPAKDSYVTTNQCMLPKWDCGGRQMGYCEHPTQLYFTGNFGGKSVQREDYNATVLHKARPSTGCKREERLHKEFYGTTTNKSVHSNLPTLVEREPLHLKKYSINNRETMKPQSGPVQKYTQYQIDNPGYVFFPPVRGMCTPAPDHLQLFYGNFDGRTEHISSYVKYHQPPRPRTSFKKKEARHTDGATFYDTTSMGVDYQPVPHEKQMAEFKSVGRVAAKVGNYQKDGKQMKYAQHFGGKFTDKSVNKNDYFQFWQTRPRQRHGDKAEQLFQPSKSKLTTVSETASNYVPLNGKPAQSFKPLDTRFSEGKKFEDKIKVEYGTAYKEHFTEKPLPRREVCQAELLLQQA